jgi:hypothetical protein
MTMIQYRYRLIDSVDKISPHAHIIKQHICTLATKESTFLQYLVASLFKKAPLLKAHNTAWMKVLLSWSASVSFATRESVPDLVP